MSDHLFRAIAAEGGCVEAFDFTLEFEQYVFSIVPSLLFLLTAPFRIFYLSRRDRKLGGQKFQFVKLFVLLLYTSLRLALLILACIYHGEKSSALQAATALSVLNAMFMSWLSYQEHSKSLRPSALLGTYLFLTLLFDAVQTRTVWLSNFEDSFRDVFSVGLGVKFLALLLEAKGKTRYFFSSNKDIGPEETAGPFSQSLFLWLAGLLRMGYGRVLTVDELYPIDYEMSSDRLGNTFWRSWDNCSKTKKRKLLTVLIKQLKWQVLTPVIPRLALVGFTFCQPIIIRRFLPYLQEPENCNTRNVGYGLIGGYGVIYLGIAISTGLYWHRTYRCITMVRGSLVSAIYTKTTELSITALDNSAAVTLMSTDVERITLGLKEVHEVWANIIQICLATWLLEKEVGLACLAPIIVASLCAAGSIGISRIAGKRQGKWMDKLQERIGVTVKMLESMKGVKISGLTQKMTQVIQNLRIDEVYQAGRFRMMIVWTATLAFLPLLLSPVVTFAIFILAPHAANESLDATRLFTSISLLLLLSQPLGDLFQSFPNLAAAFGCIDRIEAFLATESQIDRRNEYRSFQNSSNLKNAEKTENVIEAVSDCELNERKDPDKLLDHNELKTTFIRNGSFGWDKNKVALLTDINVSLERSKLTILVGPVASGKSTFLKGVLGETPLAQGTINLATTSIAFCDQTSWLQSQSVKANIVAFAEYDDAWYRSVIYACVLEEDLATFPNGDDTLVGSNGISLSGGQRQRLAIARAIYQRRELAIFDDVFSGLDTGTERHLFGRVFGPQGLLRAHRTTILLATHSMKLLPSADRIIVLGSEGRIVQQGTFELLTASEGYIQSLSLQEAEQNESQDPETNSVKQYAPIIPVQQKETAEDTEAAKNKRQIGDLAVYHYYFSAVGTPYTIIFFCIEITYAFLTAFPNVWLKWWSDANETQSQQNGKYLGVYTTLQVLNLITLTVLCWHALDPMLAKAGKHLHWVTLSTVMSAPLSFFSTADTGQIANRFSQDIQLIDNELPVALINLVANLFICTSRAILIATATFWIALSFPALLVVFYYLQNYYLRTSRQIRLLDLEAKSPLYTQFIESLSGLATIRSFSWQKDLKDLNNKLLDTSQKPFYQMFMIQRWLTLVLDLIAMAITLLVVGLAVHFKGSVNVGFAGVSLTNIISFTEMIKSMVMYWTQLETAMGAISRTMSFGVDVPSEEDVKTEKVVPDEDWPGKGRIEFRNVEAAYDTDRTHNVLQNFTLDIHPGEKIGICGRSGSGKSSLLLTLNRLLTLKSGTILINSINISTIPLHHLRSNLNSIPQDPYFLTGTIRLNVDPYETSNDQEIEEVLRKVGLWEVIEKQGGLDGVFEIGGLSHGQRQLFCLGRAVLRDGKRKGGILLCDEVTSSVDQQTEELMQRIIRGEFKNHTVISIAHRLNTLLDYDRIVVLERGKLVECDSPGNLLKRRESAFRRLLFEGGGEVEGQGLMEGDFGRGEGS